VTLTSRAELGTVFGRRFRHAARLPPRELVTTARVLAVMMIVELSIRWVPLPRLSRLLGVRVDLTSSRPGAVPMPLDDMPPGARRQLRCTRRVADAWPFSRGPCLRRALVGGHLIRRLGPAVRIGVSGGGAEVLAHAWLELEGRPLESLAGFTPFQQTSTSGTG